MVFENWDEALVEAANLAKTNDYVRVIFSRGRYYVENYEDFIRRFEKVVARFENGKRRRA